MIKKLLCNVIILSLQVSTNARAAAATSCTVTSNEVSFGTYDVFSSSPTNSTGTIRVNCNPANTTYTVALDNGSNGSIANRRMRGGRNGNDSLKYNLYTDATYSTVWGDGTGGGVTVSGTKPERFTVYGRIPPLQDVTVGSYNDTVTVTVNF